MGAVGTKSGIYVWDVKKMQLVESSIYPIKVVVRNMAMMYPYVFVVGGGWFRGLKVFNLETGDCIRDVQYNEKGFFDVHSNGRFLTITEGYWNFFLILDIQELINEKIKDSDLWKMMMENDYRRVIAVSNKTKIFVANETRLGWKLIVYNCWRDRV